MNDPRNIKHGRTIPTLSYADQPYVVVLPDNSWLCLLTTGAGEEGQAGQHIISLRSFDQGESWEKPLAIEPPSGPEASWVVPLHVPGLGGELGRVYAFYVYNGDNLRSVKADYAWAACRVDTLGQYVYKYSDNGGQTWSAERYEIPVRPFEIDFENPYGGEVRFFWSVCKPLVQNDRVFLAVHKVGRFGDGFMARSEGAFLRSDNLLSEPDPAKVNWITLPDGEIGLRPTCKPIADEQNITALSDGSLFCTYRTIEGSSCHAYSRDGGHHWTAPAHMTYGPGQRKVKHPRAANFVRRFSNGKFLYWFHNNGLQWYDGRNPAWLLGGQEVDTPEGRCIQWSQPEIVLYDEEIGTRISYPDFIEHDGEFFITETQKTIARSHPVEAGLLEWLWEGPARAAIAQEGLIADSTDSELEMPRLPALWAEPNGFSLDFRVKFDDLTPFQILFDSRCSAGNGITVMLTDRGTLKLTLCGGSWASTTQTDRVGNMEVSWESDAGLLRAGEWHSFTAIVDGGPNVLMWVVDGLICDGGTQRPYGWSFFHPNLNDLNAAPTAKVAPTLHGELGAFRLYGRALRVNEAASNHRANAALKG